MNHLSSLHRWYLRQKRDLPWRNYRGEVDLVLYRVWVSEIMLQQTQVATVIPFFLRWMEHFPTVQALARATEPQVLKLWEGLGYYSRARNLHRAAGIVCKAGKFPRTLEGWRELPGVGPYTAGAVCSIGLNLSTPIVDGNVERVIGRVEGIRPVEKDIYWKRADAWLQEATQEKLAPRDFNQALMELGATICRPQEPECYRCPLLGRCEAEKEKKVHLFPIKKKKPEVISVTEARVAFVSGSPACPRVWVQQRAKEEWLPGYWDLPRASERLAQKKEAHHFSVRHTITRHRIERKVEVRAWPKKTNPSRQGRWVDLVEPEVPVGAGYRKSVSKILSLFLKLT